MNQPISISADNPVALQNLSSRKLENEQFIGNGKIAYQIPFLKGLTATLNLGIEKAFFNDTQSESKLLASRLRNTLQTSDNTQTTSLVEPSLHYSIDLDSNSSLTLFIGYNRVHLNSENTLYKDIFVGGTLSFLGDLPSLSVNLTEQSLKAYFANFQYNFKNKLFLNTSFRTDFTDYVVGNKSHLSYGVSLTWNLLESKLFDSYSKISDLRLTASHGQIEHVPFGLFTQLSVSRINSPSTGIPLPELKNSYYTDYNLGVSLGFFENKLTGGFNYFSRKNNDLTGVFISYTGTNNSNRTIRNLADTKSEGFEVYANATVKSSVKFNWNVGFNLTYISNEVENILGGNQSLVEDKYFTFFNSVYPRFSVGETPNTFYAHQQLYDGNGNPAEGAYQDFNSDLQIDNSDLQPIGQENAKVLIGVSSAVSYKSFTFSFNGRANLGQSVFDRTDAVYGNYNSINNTNYLGNVTSSISNSNFNRSQSLSSYYIKKASFFKMDNMTITYTFPKISRKSTSLALDFTIQNAFTISQFDEQDPETINGIIQPNYLRARIWTTGLSFSF
jgi:iron complex outermembrane receptor protein